jgi:hypothetical protein
MGASCTLQLRVGSTAITAASTAGSANGPSQTIADPGSTSDRTLNLLIAGANIGGTAHVYVTYWRVPTVA